MMIARLTQPFVFVATLSLCAGCSSLGDAGDFVQIGSTKAGLFGPPAEFRALHPKLEDLLGKRVRFVAQPTGAALGEQLAQGRIAYAFMSAGEFADVADPTDLRLVACAVNAAGKTSRRAFLVAKADYQIMSIGDCKGRRFAFGTYRDPLTDLAARAALERGGVPVKDLLSELTLLTPPPIAFEGRLYRGRGVGTTIIGDLTVNAGIIDELAFSAMPETGGNIITGPSKDQFIKLGETEAVPEMVVVAGIAADAEMTEKLTTFLLGRVKDDATICGQLGVSGFTAPDRAAYDHARQWLSGLKK